MWIWKDKNWPEFTWDNQRIIPVLRTVQLNQGILIGKMAPIEDDPSHLDLDSLLANIINSSAIENEKLNACSVRSSLANKLGVSEEIQYPTSKKSDGIAKMMIDAIHNSESPLTLKRIFQWHEWLFTENELREDQIGTLRGNELMQVVSGRLDKPKVHFEAPPREMLVDEIKQFVHWFNESRNDPILDPLIRAAICHLWFVTLHPLEDGNGRITRTLTDLALAQGEKRSIRLYAMSVSILKQRKAYYEILEQSQKSTTDITEWILWFLTTLNQAITDVLIDADQTISKTRFWQAHQQDSLSKEQCKVLNRLLDGDFELGINASQYQKVAKVSRATATRHLSFLVEKDCLMKAAAGGRSTRYFIKHL